MEPEQKKIGSEISATKSCVFCGHHDIVVERKDHECLYNTPDHKKQCSLCNESSNDESSSCNQSATIIYMEKGHYAIKRKRTVGNEHHDEHQSTEVDTPDANYTEFKQDQDVIEVVINQSSLSDESPNVPEQQVKQRFDSPGTSSNISSNPSPLIIFKPPGLNNVSTIPPFVIRNENDTKMRLHPYGYPKNIFKREVIAALKNYMDNPITNAPYTRYDFSTFEKGSVVIKGSNIEAAKEILSLIKTLAYCPDNSGLKCEIIVSRAADNNFYIKLSCTIDRETGWDAFRRKICKSNEMHDAWLYDDNIERTEDGKFKISFLVDPLSFQEKISDTLYLRYGDEQVIIDVMDNRYATDMETYAQLLNRQQ